MRELLESREIILYQDGRITVDGREIR